MDIGKARHLPKAEDPRGESDNKQIGGRVVGGADNFGAWLVEVVSFMNPPTGVRDGSCVVPSNSQSRDDRLSIRIRLNVESFPFPCEDCTVTTNCEYLEHMSAVSLKPV